MKTIKKENAQTAAEMAGAHIGNALEQAKSSNVPVLLLLSGGSSLNLMDYVNPTVFGKFMTIGMLDERFYEDPAINTFSIMTKHPFYQTASGSGAGFIDSRMNGEEKQMAQIDGTRELAQRMGYEFANWKEHNLDGKVYITQGIGADGHTAGIMPFPDDQKEFAKSFENENYWVIGYDAGEKNMYRFRTTVTNPFLRGVVDLSIVYAVGQEKAESLAKTMSANGLLHETPARIIHEMKEAYLYTDQG